MGSWSEPGIRQGHVELGFGGQVCETRLKGCGLILGIVWEYFSFCYVVGRMKYKKKGKDISS